ncbi:MAG TPA: DUF2268 domain-containing putative Zn-dependent protease [Parvularculaceae bacterium]|nr:DUF2268 domain-containing putative Zn-dependent protease [Parvularculaceae bacterium]
MRKVVIAVLLIFTGHSAPALAGVDPLSARINTEDAERFASVFNEADGAPDAATLQAGYIEPGSAGLKIFTPGRIENGENLAEAISKNPSAYRRAIDVCLPIASSATSELRAVYLALEGLLGDSNLPEIYALFGAGNSGGTAGPGAQVIGLEVICRDAQSEEEIRALLRSFFAHETVHTLQDGQEKLVDGADYLTASVILEGTADYVAALVTGKTPSPERAAWAAPRAEEIWAAFEKDRKKMKKLSSEKQFQKGSPLYRWVANVGATPDGWPAELGYWLGKEIASAYVEAAPDKKAAVKELIEMTDPDLVLKKSGYGARLEASARKAD